MKNPLQDQSSRVLCDILLTVGRTVALQVDPTFAVTGVRNPLLLDEWRELAPQARRDRPATLRPLLEEMMPASRARELERQIVDGLANMGPAGLHLGIVALHPTRGSAMARHVAASFHRVSEAGELLLMLRDVTPLADVQQALSEVQMTADASIAALRAPSNALRIFLNTALTSISVIRGTIRLPARDQAAVHDKLARLQAAVTQLDTDAAQLQLTPVQDHCQALLNRLGTLQQSEHVSGDALLPLAGMVDRIAGCIGLLWRIEEQRHAEAAPAAQVATPRSRRQPDWNFASERRWASLLSHRGKELGVLVALQIDGTKHVPRQLRAGVDQLLQHMLRNAVEHGIETPQDRLSASKPVSGNVSVKFEPGSNAQLRMTVRDDGRGRGLGLSFLRKSVARLGGQIAVAAKPDEYTEFVIDLPHAMSAEMPAQTASQ
jgi:signal transduction histidine kinase